MVQRTIFSKIALFSLGSCRVNIRNRRNKRQGFIAWTCGERTESTELCSLATSFELKIGCEFGFPFFFQGWVELGWQGSFCDHREFTSLRIEVKHTVSLAVIFPFIWRPPWIFLPTLLLKFSDPKG